MSQWSEPYYREFTTSEGRKVKLQLESDSVSGKKVLVDFQILGGEYSLSSKDLTEILLESNFGK